MKNGSSQNRKSNSSRKWNSNDNRSSPSNKLATKQQNIKHLGAISPRNEYEGIHGGFRYGERIMKGVGCCSWLMPMEWWWQTLVYAFIGPVSKNQWSALNSNINIISLVLFLFLNFTQHSNIIIAISAPCTALLSSLPTLQRNKPNNQTCSIFWMRQWWAFNTTYYKSYQSH